MRPFLVLQLRPEDAAADSEYEAILRYGGLSPDEVVRVRLDREPFPEIAPEEYSAIVVGGSPFELSTPEPEKTDLQKRIEDGFARLVAWVVENDFPFLGACSGSSLLGAHCGVSISSRYREPVGGTEVSLTDEGRSDPLLFGLPDRFRAMVGHKEACDETPPGAVLLVTSLQCPVQMFRVGRNVYATQFHPEGDPEGFILRVRTYLGHGYFLPEEAADLIETLENEHAPVPHRVLARFVERYRK
ncbi:MAG: glutamine amidotransferase [Gemmatimonadetes bacterium]|nr:glutamine amidotransferase [Gemmatimonadota bacterium]